MADIDWATIMSALQAFAAAQVTPSAIWSKQDAPQPAPPYCTLEIQHVRKVGFIDARNTYMNPVGSPPLGQEVEIDSVGIREFVLHIEAFTPSTLVGSSSAAALLQAAQGCISKPSVRDAMRASCGLAFIEAEEVHDISQKLETVWQGRAFLDIRFRTTVVLPDFTGYVTSLPLSTSGFTPDGVTPPLNPPIV
jgi:hypothetical protein